MIRCFGGGFREDSLADEVAWLKRTLERETQQRQAAQAQLAQEQAKCALLEQEILQASQAAHEMGESLRQYFSQAAGSECSDATTATMHAWAAALTGSACLSAEPSLAGDTPSGTSYSGTPIVQQQQHSLRGVAPAAGVEHIPQELKFMAPLRRHQQYLGTT
ncbi:hypothetical protein OEZ86_001053 [Tetradesmus obliquus]|nr:hypothetical protein OEZ86_001053 [Tetradesmus obliquus]